MQKNICITFYLYVETENGDKQVDVINFFLIFWKEILESCCFGYTRYSILLNAVLLSGTGEGMCLRHIVVVRCRRAPHCRVGLLRVCASGTSLSCVAAAPPHCRVWLLRVCASGTSLSCVAAVPHTVVWGY